MRLRWLVVGVLILVVAAVVAVAVFANRLIDANRERLLAAVQGAIGRPVHVGAIRAHLLGRPGIRVDDLSVAEDPKFGEQPFLAARSATVLVQLRPLFDGRIEIARIVLEQPRVRILRAADGSFNYASLGPSEGNPALPGQAEASRASEPARLTWLVAVFDIDDGEVTYIDSRAKPPRTIAVTKISLEASDIALDKAIHFELRAAYDAADENVDLTGDAGPVNDPNGIAFHVGGRIGPLPGLLPAALTNLDARGRVHGDVANVESFAFSGFGGAVAGAATAPTDGSGPLALEAHAEGVEVQQVLPLVAPELRGQLDGAATAALVVQGELDRPEVMRRSVRGSGSLDVRNGVLHGFNLAGEVVNRLTSMPGLSKLIASGVKPKYAEVINRAETRFDVMKLRLTLVPGAAVVDSMVLDGEDFGATASGRVTLPNIADLHGEVLLSRRFSEDIAADVKEARLLFDADDKIALPFVYRGVIGQAKPEADVEKLTASVLKGRGQDLLDALLQGGEKGEDAVDSLRRGLKGLLGR